MAWIIAGAVGRRLFSASHSCDRRHCPEHSTARADSLSIAPTRVREGALDNCEAGASKAYQGPLTAAMGGHSTWQKYEKHGGIDTFVHPFECNPAMRPAVLGHRSAWALALVARRNAAQLF